MSPPACFVFAGTEVASDWPPPSYLEQRTTARPALAVTRPSSVSSDDSAGSGSLYEWRAADGGLILSLARSEQGYLLRFPRLLDFEISDDGATIQAHQPDAIAPETLWHLLLDQVLPRALSHRRRHIVHAAGVVSGDVAVAFVGDTGAGKSTLAGEFARGGSQILSDDALVIDPVGEEHRVIPTYPSLRLWSDSLAELELNSPELLRVAHYSDKRRVQISPPAADHTGNSWALAGIYHLDPAPSAETTFTRLSPRDAVTVLLRESFQLDVSDISAAAWLLDRCAHLADQVPVFSLGYPRDFRHLEGVRRTLINHVAELVD
jgi:hypothetical protein